MAADSQHSKEVQAWLDRKLEEFKEDPVGTLESMLINTIDIVEQAKQDPNGRASKAVLDACLECTRIFLEAIDGIDEETSSG